MKGRTLVILVVVAVVLGGWAYMSSTRKNRLTRASTEIGKPLLRELRNAETLNSIDSLNFIATQGTVTVAKVEGKWVSPRKYNYPVDFDRVSEFLRKMAELKIGQTLPSSAGQMKALSLVSPRETATDDAATLIELESGSGNTVASLLVGREHSRQAPDDSPYGRGFGSYPDGRFVSPAGEKAYLVAETFSSIPPDDNAWLDKQIANVPSSDITKLSVTEPDGKSLTLVRADGKTDMALADLAEGEEMDTVKASGLAGVLSWLNFEDVADPSKTDEELGFEKPAVLTAETVNGKVYTMKLGAGPEGSDKRYVRLSAEYRPPEVEEKEAVETDSEAASDAAAPAESSGQDSAKAEADREKEEEQKKLAGEVKEFNAKVSGWTYVLTAYEVKDIGADRQALLKEKDEGASELEADVAPEPEPEDK